MRGGWIGISVVALACTVARPRTTNSVEATATRPDSIVLHRSPCYGTCPVYRLRVDGTGRVAFDDGRVLADSVSPSIVDSLMAFARDIGLLSLPDTIVSGSPYCQDEATDHSTITLDLFGAKPKRMLYYTGCYTGTRLHAASDPMRRLKSFAAKVDTLSLATRWIQPARRR
jgi:uncharacterized protein DUF6438